VCVCVAGETSAMGRALDMILEKICSDPSSNSCPNVSYSEPQQAPSSAGGATGGAGSKLHTGMIPNHPSFAMLRYSLRFCGYTESSIEEVVSAVYTLASYGFLSLAEGSPDGAMDPSSLATMLGMATASFNYQYPENTSSSDTMASYGVPAGTSVPTSANYAMTVSGFNNNSANTSMPYGTYPGFMNSNTGCYGQNSAYQFYGHGGYNPANYSGSGSIAPPPPPPPPSTTTEAPKTADTVTHSFEIGEHIVGVLLGPGGRSIIDLQTWTGATVEVSKKGVFAPGTRNRIVTVTGSAPAVQSATYFIKQCIDHEEMRRASSSTQSSPQRPVEPPSDTYGQSWPAPQQTAR